MKISFSQQYVNNSFYSPLKPNKGTIPASQDVLIMNNKQNQNTVSFGKSFFDFFIERMDKSGMPSVEDENATPYAKALAAGMKTYMEKEIPANNFRGIMTPDEFRELLPSLSAENFTSSRKNQDSGAYFVDLDYQSSFSRGKENIFDILDSAAKYADYYYAKHKKDFVFALTDRDTLDGVRHAVRIIAENPDKFKHMKFLPAIKLSYAHEAPNSQLKYENSDMLIYGINPFSSNLSNFVETTIEKRKSMILDFIRQVYSLYPEFAYNVIEFAEQNSLKYKRDFTVSNLYWRAREYAETKGDTAIKGISLVPEDVISEAEAIINQLGRIYVGSDSSAFSTTGSQIITDEEVNKTIKSVFEKYSTHVDETQGRVVSAAENLYDDMIDCLIMEPENPVLALSAPYYLSHYCESKSATNEFPNVVDFINDLQERSAGMLMAFETVVPGYDLDPGLSADTIKNFNNYIKEHTDLYEVGGSFAKRF